MKVLTSRIDHYWRVARIMMKSYHLYDDIKSAKLRSYMLSYFTIIMAICSVFSRLSDRPDAMDELDKLWAELKAYDPRMYRHTATRSTASSERSRTSPPRWARRPPSVCTRPPRSS